MYRTFKSLTKVRGTYANSTIDMVDFSRLSRVEYQYQYMMKWGPDRLSRISSILWLMFLELGYMCRIYTSFHVNKLKVLWLDIFLASSQGIVVVVFPISLHLSAVDASRSGI